MTMANFLEEILKSGAAQQVLGMLKEKVADNGLTDIIGQVTADSKYGELATGVINVIGLATKAVNKGEEAQDE